MDEPAGSGAAVVGRSRRRGERRQHPEPAALGPDNSDATIGAGLLEDDITLPATAEPSAAGGAAAEAGEPVEVLGDSAYGTGEMLDALDRTGRKATIKPWPTRPAVEGGFTIDDFNYDDQAGTLTCPNGLTRRHSTKRRVTFGAACRGCPLRDQCTTSPQGRKITVHRHERLQRHHRRRAQDLDFQQTYREKRPLVERTIAWLVNGNRRVPYRGVAKNNAWLQHRLAGLNLRRLLAMGLNLSNGTWQLA